ARYEPRGCDAPREQRFVFPVFSVLRETKPLGSAECWPPGTRKTRRDQRDTRGIRVVTRQNRPEMLLFEFDRRKIHEQEDDREKYRQRHASRGRGESKRGNECAQIKRIAREGVWPRFGKHLVLAQVPCGPRSQRKAAYRYRQSDGKRYHARMREVRESGNHREAEEN